jgi:cephalosporin hydroxylase
MKATSFGGIPCAQIWIDFILWENLLNDQPQVKGIVEIGTWKGGFSLFLQAQAAGRDLGFHTFDVEEPEADLNPNFTKLDVWARPGSVQMYLAAWSPVVLFCDGGNKPRELKTFAPMCGEGSVFVVHDWGTEMLPEDVPEGLVEMYGDWCDTVGSITRVFKAA